MSDTINQMPEWSLKKTGEDTSCLHVKGAWSADRDNGTTFSFDPQTCPPTTKTLTVDASQLTGWDSSFISFMWSVKQKAQERKIQFIEDGLPKPTTQLLDLLPSSPTKPAEPSRTHPKLLARIGESAENSLQEIGSTSLLASTTVKETIQSITGKGWMCSRDFFNDLWQAGPDALLIVGVVNFLVGAILAFVGLMELRVFAAQAYVTSLVGIGCARELSAMMTAIVMSGRTGGAYAARISTMLGNDEIDALKVFGIPVSAYLLLPAILSLAIMMPLLYIYGTILGMLGGFAVSMTMMDISPYGYWLSTFDHVDLKEFNFGFVKAFFFAVFIALASCRIGLQAGRSSADVGIAATRAVVISIVGIIGMDAIFAVIAHVFDF